MWGGAFSYSGKQLTDDAFSGGALMTVLQVFIFFSGSGRFQCAPAAIFHEVNSGSALLTLDCSKSFAGYVTSYNIINISGVARVVPNVMMSL